MSSQFQNLLLSGRSSHMEPPKRVPAQNSPGTLAMPPALVPKEKNEVIASSSVQRPNRH